MKKQLKAIFIETFDSGSDNISHATLSEQQYFFTDILSQFNVL